MEKVDIDTNNEFILDTLVQTDLTGVYKNFGGLGTAAGRKMYAMYNKDASSELRNKYSFKYDTQKPAPTPLEQERAKVKARAQAHKQKTTYIPEQPIRAPYESRYAPIDFVPHRRSERTIRNRMKIDAETSKLPTLSISGTNRSEEIERLQDRMESSNVKATLGVRVDNIKPAQPKKVPVKPGKMQGRRTQKELNRELYNSIVQEIKEREDWLAEMRTIQEDFYEIKIDKEIKERIAALKELDRLMDEDESGEDV